MPVFDRIIALVSELKWVAVVLVAIALFKRELRALLTRTERVTWKDGCLSWILGISEEKRSEALPKNGDVVMTKDDVREILLRVPGIKREDVETNLPYLHEALRRRDVVTKAQLQDLVGSGSVMDELKRLYVEELGRPKDAPLDASAIATYGPAFYLYGCTPSMVEAVRKDIRLSPEYRRKHR